MISELRTLSTPRSVITCLAVIAALFAGFVVGLNELRDAWRFAGLVFAIIVLVWRDDLENDKQALLPLVLGALAGFITGAGLQAAYAAWWNHAYMREYDFFALYMDAHVAWHRLDFYEPLNYQAAYERLAPPFAEMHPGFKRNVLETGTKYPPPTLLYLAPFGALERLPAHIVWVLVSWIFMLGSSVLLWRNVVQAKSLVSLMAIGTLVLIAPGTKLTLSLEQMHFTALFALLLVYMFRYRPMAGLWVAVGTIIKPPVGAAALYLLRVKNWSGIAVLFVSTIVLCTASIAAFGWDVFVRFFVDNPNLRVSNSLYFEDMNRSMLGTVIRNFGWDFESGSPMKHPVLLIGTCIVTVITLTGVLLTQNLRDPRVFALLVCFALLVYPGTQRHYAVILLFPLVVFMVTADRSGWARWLIAAIAAAIASFSVAHTFWMTLALWLTLLALIVTDRDGDPQTSV